MATAGEHPATSMTVAIAERDGSATLIAVMVICEDEGSVVGAV